MDKPYESCFKGYKALRLLTKNCGAMALPEKIGFIPQNLLEVYQLSTSDLKITLKMAAHYGLRLVET